MRYEFTVATKLTTTRIWTACSSDSAISAST
jgi:hypothetical protein